MNTTRLVLVALVLTACGSRLTPKERYVQALNHRLDGDPQACFDELLALAHDEPESRAGRRARATIQSGGVMTQVAVVGVLAAIAIPNFLKFQTRARQAEAKSNLEALHAAQRAYFAEQNRYCTSFQRCGWKPESGARYIYLLSRQEMLGGDQSESSTLLRMRASAELAELGVTPEVRRRSFLAVAVGNIDSDSDLDVWSIDELGQLENLVNDVD